MHPLDGQLWRYVLYLYVDEDGAWPYQYADGGLCAALYGSHRVARDMLFREYLDGVCAWERLCACVAGCRGWRGTRCVCGYLGVLGEIAMAGANRRAWALLRRAEGHARLDFIAEGAVTRARVGVESVLRMVSSPMWSPSLDGDPQHVRVEIEKFGRLMGMSAGFLMAFRAWRHVDVVLKAPTAAVSRRVEGEFQLEVRRTVLSMKYAACEILAAVVQKLVPLGQRRAFEVELWRQYLRLGACDRVPEVVVRRIFGQVFMAHGQTIGLHLRGAALGPRV